MSKYSAIHDTFVIERKFDVPPKLAFSAWSSREAKGRWFVGPDEWEGSNLKMDFKVGGRESISGGPPGGVVHYYNAMYQDIVPDERIVLTYDMHLDKNRISVSLATVEFKPDGKGTRMTYTEQGVYLDGYDNAGQRKKGTNDLLDALERELKSKG